MPGIINFGIFRKLLPDSLNRYPFSATFITGSSSDGPQAIDTVNLLPLGNVVNDGISLVCAAACSAQHLVQYWLVSYLKLWTSSYEPTKTVWQNVTHNLRTYHSYHVGWIPIYPLTTDDPPRHHFQKKSRITASAGKSKKGTPNGKKGPHVNNTS